MSELNPATSPKPQALIAARGDNAPLGRRFPESTYRLQFHVGFTFHDATHILPYLRQLGITHVYSSPILKAREGSLHGYDVIDHSALNPELGSPDDFAQFTTALHKHDLQLIVDIVPNHMGVATNDNAWWNDVLTHGPASAYAGYFDIAWRGSPRPQLHDKVLLPLLGKPYGQALESGELQIRFDGAAFHVHYYERKFPLSPQSTRLILAECLPQLREAMGADDPFIVNLVGLIDAASPELMPWLSSQISETAAIRGVVEKAIAPLNGMPADPASFDRLDSLLNDQAYRLADWHTAPDEINYRRFFDINDLAALCMERQDVFRDTHAFILRLVKEGIIAGLRVDHPDGVYDPEQYFQWVQQAALDGDEDDSAFADAPPLYVVAEKILAFDEALPSQWAVHGTTGYEFINRINGLFVDPAVAAVFTPRYQDWVQSDLSFEQLAYEKKRLILDISLASELQMLAHQLDQLAQRNRMWRDFTLASLRCALREVIACFPVYRSYISDRGVAETDVRYIETAIAAAIERNRNIHPSIFHFIRDVLLLHYPDRFTDDDRAAQRRLAGKFQQLTAPVTAKGIEDTAFYIYNRLVSLNEVGGDPGHFGDSPDSLHRWLADRQAQWPHALSPLSTHDTKRSEDVRARLNVLPEMPDEFWQRVVRWGRLNEPHRRGADGKVSPAPNDEFLLYQTLIGAWPLAGVDEAFVGRIQQYMRKAMREAKVSTTWTQPNSGYEEAVSEFIASILDPARAALFLQDFRAFQRRISHFGMLNSLSQTLLRLTAPGAPDTYQGTDLWDFSLVDPDNRRPVDYALRQRLISELAAQFDAVDASWLELAKDLIAHKEDGRVKLYITWRALCLRRQLPGLFSVGEYHPLQVHGPQASHVFAFLRRNQGRWALVAAPRLLARLTPAAALLPIGEQVWAGTELLLPADLQNMKFRNALTGETVASSTAGQLNLPLSKVFSHLPIALFIDAATPQ